MTVATEISHVQALDIVAGVPINCAFPAYENVDISVVYGIAELLATPTTDYTVSLNPPIFDTFTVTPTAALLTKINTLIATNPLEVNKIDIYRDLDFKTSTTAPAVTFSPFTSREFDRAVLRDQQLSRRIFSEVQNRIDDVDAEEAARIEADDAIIGLITSGGTGSGADAVKEWLDLDNVDNTSDLNKPISNLTQTALNGKLSITTGALNQALTSKFIASQGARIHRVTDRIFGGRAINFNGEFSGEPFRLSLDPLIHSLHSWAFRDADFIYDSPNGTMAVVGHAQASKVSTAWPAYPAANPASIGASGFAVNDRADGLGVAWGVYSDAVVMPSGGFTVSLESAIVNFASEQNMDPFNALTSASRGGIGHWIQSGGGLDAVANPDGSMWDSLNCFDVNHATAGTVYLSSYNVAVPTLWVTGHAYTVGNCVKDPNSDIVFTCRVAHTSSGAFMSTYRAANPTHWKQRPAFRKGIVFAAGALAETSPGSNFFTGIDFQERTRISWMRNNAGVTELSGFILVDTSVDGAAPNGITMGGGLIHSLQKWAGAADGTYGGILQGRGNGGANGISFRWNSAVPRIEIYVDNTLVGNVPYNAV